MVKGVENNTFGKLGFIRQKGLKKVAIKTLFLYNNGLRKYK